MTTRARKPATDTLKKLRAKSGGTGTARTRATAVDRLRDLYRGVKVARIEKDRAEQTAKSLTQVAVSLATEHDMREEAVSFDIDGVMYVGTIISPKGSDKWDLEKVVEYAHKKGIWDSVSTRVFDQDKWEAEVASGNIRPTDANKLKEMGTPGTPYVKVVSK